MNIIATIPASVRSMALVAPILLAGCRGKDAQPAPEPPAAPAPATAPAPAPPVPAAAETKAAAGHASPEATVNTLIKACAARDKAAVAACFAKTAEGEFKRIVDLTAPDDEWNGLFEFFRGATVTGASGDVVAVKLTTRDEEINLVKEGAAWKVAGF